MPATTTAPTSRRGWWRSRRCARRAGTAGAAPAAATWVLSVTVVPLSVPASVVVVAVGSTVTRRSPESEVTYAVGSAGRNVAV